MLWPLLTFLFVLFYSPTNIVRHTMLLCGIYHTLQCMILAWHSTGVHKLFEQMTLTENDEFFLI